MKLRLRRQAAPSGRQRQAPTASSRVSPNLSYQSRRPELADAADRQSQRQAIKTAGHNAGQYWLQRFGLIVLLLAAIFSTINILSLSAQPKVLPLVTGQQAKFLRDPILYQNAAQSYLQASIWNRNKLTVNTGAVDRQLLEQFPELASASVTVPLVSHRPLIYVQPAEPAVILVTTTGAFVLATSGKALLTATNAADLNLPSLPTITDLSGLSLRLNHQALPTTTINFIQTVLAQLAAKRINVGAITLPGGASELDVQIAGQPYSVKFNLQSTTARQQVGTLLATMGQLQKQKDTPVKYIDVRVNGRAYYQ